MTYFGCVNKFAQHVYFLANLKYANELLKHMSRGYICTCPPCLLIFELRDQSVVMCEVNVVEDSPKPSRSPPFGICMVFPPIVTTASKMRPRYAYRIVDYNRFDYLCVDLLDQKCIYTTNPWISQTCTSTTRGTKASRHDYDTWHMDSSPISSIGYLDREGSHLYHLYVCGRTSAMVSCFLSTLTI